MDNGWQQSASAWIADMGEDGDFGRRYVLDPVMLPRALRTAPRRVLDVGCGEGRFCRALRRHNIDAIGIDPTHELLSVARDRDVGGTYLEASGDSLPFAAESFDLVVSYLTLIDIPNYQTAIAEMARVLRSGGSLLIANLNGFSTACADAGWVKGQDGRRLHYPVDNYLDERALWIEYRGIRIMNHHRPMSSYLRVLLSLGLRLVYFDEPSPIPEARSAKANNYRRVPWFHVMEWRKPD